MKRFNQYVKALRWALAIVMCVVYSGSAWAESKTYYYKAEAYSTGNGSAYVSKDGTNYTEDPVTGDESSFFNSVQSNLYFKAEPAEGYGLDHWAKGTANGQNVGSANPLHVTDPYSSQDQNNPTSIIYYAVFKPAVVNVRVASGDEGKGSVSISGNNANGGSVTLTATPNTEDGMAFLGWTYKNGTNYVSTDENYTFTIDNNNQGTYYAHFKELGKSFVRLQNVSTGRFLSLYGNAAATAHNYNGENNNPDGFTFDGSLKMISETDAQGNPMTVFMRMGTSGTDFTEGNLKAAGVAYNTLVNSASYPLTMHQKEKGNYVIYTTKNVKTKKFHITREESSGGFWSSTTTYYLGTDGYFSEDNKVEWEMDDDGYISSDGHYLIYYTSGNNANYFYTTTTKPTSDIFKFAFDGTNICQNNTSYFIRYRTSGSGNNTTRRAYRSSNNNSYAKAEYDEFESTADKYSFLFDEGSDSPVMKTLVTKTSSKYKDPESTPEEAEWRIYELKEGESTVGAFGANAKAANTMNGKYYTSMFAFFPYKLSSGVKAYYLPMDENLSYDRNANKVTLTEVPNGIVPANTAVVLECDAVQDNSVNNLLYPIVDESTVQALGYENLLRGYNYVVGRDQQIANDGENMYILATKNGKLAFYHSSGTYMSPNKAFLDLTNLPSDLQQAAKTATFSFGDIDDEEEGTVTGIKIAEGKNNDADGAIYDLLGRKVENPGRGIYIRNNKKFVVK